MIATIVHAPITSLISGITSSMVKHIKSRFSPNFFLQTYIAGSNLAFTQANYTSSKDKFTRKFPLLAMNPIFSIDGLSDINVAALNPITDPAANITGFNNFNKLEVLKSDKAKITALARRMVVNFECIIQLDVGNQAINTVNQVKNSFLFDQIQVMENELTVEIPKEFLELIYPNKTIDQMDAKEIALLTLGKVQKKKNLSTGNIQFFFTYSANIMMKFESLSYEKNMMKMTQGKSAVKFSVTTEAWFLSMFTLEDSFGGAVNEDTYLRIKDIYSKMGAGIELNFSVKLNPLDKIMNGNQLLWSFTYMSDANVVQDILPVTEDIPAEIKTAILLHPEKYDIVVVDEYNAIVTPTTGYTVNPATLNITLLYPFFNTQYMVCIFAKKDYIAQDVFMEE